MHSRCGQSSFLRALVKLFALVNLLHMFCSALVLRKWPRLSRIHMQHGATNSLEREQHAIVGDSRIPSVSKLLEIRSNLRLFPIEKPNCVVKNSRTVKNALHKPFWFSYCNGLQIDCCELEPHAVSTYRVLEADKELAFSWDSTVHNRIQRLLANDHKSAISAQKLNPFHKELSIALCAVQRASFIARSLQYTLLSGDVITGLTSKSDNTPVTIADYVVQALIVDAISKYFPVDSFKAEEDSGLLNESQNIIEQVQLALEAATGESWSLERLLHTIDRREGLSSTQLSPKRAWILDPIDGTKGFLRGQHFCIALALLIDGKPQLSVLGCPNINIDAVISEGCMQNEDGRSNEFDCSIDPPLLLDQSIIQAGKAASRWPFLSSETSVLPIFPPNAGSIFYAMTGKGSYVVPLGDIGAKYGSALSTKVCNLSSKATVTLCESAEAAFGNRTLSANIHSLLVNKMQKQAPLTAARIKFLQLDGQCKHCLVGAGVAAATLRLPPKGYREKIWDHVPGVHFVTEAGGISTDQSGRSLNFDVDGVLLSADIENIVTSCGGQFHQDVLECLRMST